MPYEDERAGYEPLRRIASNERIRALLSQYKIMKAPPRKKDQLITVHRDALPASDWRPHWVVAVDGSYLTATVENGFPGAEVAYLTIGSVMLDMERIRKLDEQRPAPPVEFRKTQQAEGLEQVLPGRNVAFEGHTSARVSFRKALYDLMDQQRMSSDGESLLDTYHALLELRPGGNRAIACPYDDCKIEGNLEPSEGISRCVCKDERDIFSTDSLRIHERMNPEAGSNDRIYSEVMQVIERLWIVHILRTMEQKRWLSSLQRLAILVDGPLAIFGQPAWLSQAIFQELKRINALVRQETGQDILWLGIEKSGEFIEHFAQLDEEESGAAGKFPAQTAALLNDRYIKRHIIFSESEQDYGKATYFGRKFFYKTRSGARIVATVACLDDHHKNIKTAEVGQFPRLADAMHLLDDLVSSRFPNSLQPIVAAHAEASIPLNMGKRVLEQLARELTQKR